MIDEAGFLNDLATDENGYVYISDMKNSRIYRIANQKVSIFAEGDHLEHPNGLLAVGDRLYCGGWGTGFNKDDFTTKELGRFYYLDINSKKRAALRNRRADRAFGRNRNRRTRRILFNRLDRRDGITYLQRRPRS